MPDIQAGLTFNITSTSIPLAKMILFVMSETGVGKLGAVVPNWKFTKVD